MAIARDIINRAFRLIGNTDSGESGESAEYADALQCLNDLLADWSGAQPLIQYSNTLLNYPIPSSLASFSIGPTGSLVSERPAKIKDVYLHEAGTDYPLELISSSQYADISQKTSIGGYPTLAFYDASTTNARLYLWPNARAGQVIYFTALQSLQVFVNLTDTVTLPSNYNRALVYNLAVEIAPEYGQEASATVLRTAMLTKSAIKRLNAKAPILVSEAGYLSSSFDGGGGAARNIVTSGGNIVTSGS